jgi:hypothetical protein
MGTFVELQHALLLGNMASLSLKKKILFQTRTKKKKEGVFWNGTSSDAQFCETYGLFFR